MFSRLVKICIGPLLCCTPTKVRMSVMFRVMFIVTLRLPLSSRHVVMNSMAGVSDLIKF